MDYEKLPKQPRGSTFVSRRSVATTFGEMRKTLEEYGSWIGYRLRVGYSLIPRSDEQIRTGWHLWEPRTREELEKTLACFQHTAKTTPSDHRLRSHWPDIFNAGNVWCARLRRDV